MTADVIESAQFAVLVADNNQTFTRYFRGKISAGIGDLTLMPN